MSEAGAEHVLGLRSRIWPVALLLPVLIWILMPFANVRAEGVEIPNPGTDLWRELRQRGDPGEVRGAVRAPGMDLQQEVRQGKALTLPTGRTQVQGADAGQLINPLGDQWRRFRMERLIPYAGYILPGMLLFLLLFYLIRGRITIEGGVTSHKLFRYTVYERMIHWFTAFVFLFLALTGLVLLFGRAYLLPWMGAEAFAVVASASKEGHNLFGPLFALALALIFFRFVRRNIYERGDLTWLLKGGGIIGKKHLPSNFFNMGEKTMFWMLVLVGGGIAVTGIILVFPVLGQGRVIMELSHVAHTIGAVVMVTVVIGHIYIGSVGMEGALEGMKTGYCDLNWAKEHHDWWASECEKKGEVLTNEEVAAVRGEHAGGAASMPATGESGK